MCSVYTLPPFLDNRNVRPPRKESVPFRPDICYNGSQTEKQRPEIPAAAEKDVFSIRKKVYFAGSIRGGRADEELYRRIIGYIRETDTVLTEHVGDPTLICLEQDADKDAAIYAQDTAWLRESDLVIAECSNPSLGVGYELAYAEALGKPCWLLYRPSRTQLSAMLSGDAYFHIVPYEEEAELFAVLDGILRG